MEFIDTEILSQNLDFDSFRGVYGSEFTDEMISHSVQTASDFFHIENPGTVFASPSSTGVFLNNLQTLGDDVLNVDIQQLQNLGISSQDSLNLVMTHETTHRMLQDMTELPFSSHQEELCCDFMSGVRAGLNNIDISQMEESLMNTVGGDTHPEGSLRAEALRDGVSFAQSYLEENLSSPTFEDCLDYFCQNDLINFDSFNLEHTEGIMHHNFIRNDLHKTMQGSLEAMQYWVSRVEDAENIEEMHSYHNGFMTAKHEFDQTKLQYAEIVNGDSDVEKDDPMLMKSVELNNKIFELERQNNIVFGANKTDEEWYKYYVKKADHAFEQEKWHYDRAAKASARGDEAAAKDHIARAKSWHNDAEKYMRSAAIYKKS